MFPSRGKREFYLRYSVYDARPNRFQVRTTKHQFATAREMLHELGSQLTKELRGECEMTRAMLHDKVLTHTSSTMPLCSRLNHILA